MLTEVSFLASLVLCFDNCNVYVACFIYLFIFNRQVGMACDLTKNFTFHLRRFSLNIIYMQGVLLFRNQVSEHPEVGFCKNLNLCTLL